MYNKNSREDLPREESFKGRQTMKRELGESPVDEGVPNQ